MRKLLLVIITLLPVAALFAQGKITGTVKDGNTGEAIAAATLSLRKDSLSDPLMSTMTEVDGTYQIKAVPGVYELEVAAFGYQKKVITGIETKDNNTVAVNISVSEPAQNDIDEVVIRANVRNENVNALYALQKANASVSDGISADLIRQSPDKNTGEVLKRISGTTIQDNKFVIIRGMSDRYNVAAVDNSVLPSTEPNKRSFSFDIIPSNMIDNIVITKTATPDLPGDFAGGYINVLTKEVPDENFNNLSAGVGYNTASTFKTFRSGYRTATDFLGFDNGERQLPKGFPASRQLQSTNLTPEESIPYIKELNNDFTIKEHNALPALNFQGSMGRVYNLSRNRRFGITAALSYNHTENIKQELLRQYDNYNYTDNQYVYSSNIGALLNLGYYFGNSKITLKTFYNKVFDDTYLYRTGYDNGSSSDIRYYAFDLQQKSLFKTTLNGAHQMGKGNAKFNWDVSYNNVTNDRPDQRKVLYARGAGTTDAYAANLTSLGKANSRLFGKLNEHIGSAAANIAVPVHGFLSNSIFKAGISGQYRYRDFNNRYLGMLLDPSFDDVRYRDVGSLFADDAINEGAYALADQTLSSDKYNASATTLAAYAMMDNRITDNLRAVWGIRMEDYNFHLNSTEEEKRHWLDILPSLNFTYSLNDNSNLRLSCFRSVARPEMREMANILYYDYELSATMLGNTNLQRSLIDNIDFRYEIYPRPGEILSASVFYKHFKNTLEYLVDVPNSSYDIKPFNYQGANNIGAELVIRKKLDGLFPNSFLKNLTAYLNLSYVHSRVDLKDHPLYILNDTFTSRPLSGQSPFVINASLNYNSNDGKWSVTMLYNRLAQSLYLVGGGRLSNVYEMPRNVLDIQIGYNISAKSTLKLNIKDLLNDPVLFYFDQDLNGKFGDVGFSPDGGINSSKDWILQKYKPGTGISLSYSLSF